MRISAILVIATAFRLCSARAVPQSHALHERRDPHAHHRHAKRLDATSNLQLPMRVGLKHNDHAAQNAHDWLMDVSHPSSAKFGKHWTQEEVLEAFRPTNETIQTVYDWLSTTIHKSRLKLTDNKSWFAFDATVAEAEALLHTEFFHSVLEQDRGSLVHCNEYHLPKHVQRHVDYVTPGVKGTLMNVEPQHSISKRNSTRQNNRRRSKLKPRAACPTANTVVSSTCKNNTELATCDTHVTPACLRALYHFDALDPQAEISSNNTMGVYEENDSYSQEDLDLFFANCTRHIPKGTHPIMNSIAGGSAPVPTIEAGLESGMDLMMAYPIIYPQTITLYQLSHGSTFNTFLDAIDGSYCTYSAYGQKGNDSKWDPPCPLCQSYAGPLQCGIYKPANVISISYSDVEGEYYPTTYQKRQCNEFLKLGLMGSTIVMATGDDGVASSRGSHDNDEGCMRNGTVFAPAMQNSCPYCWFLRHKEHLRLCTRCMTRSKPLMMVYLPQHLR